MSPRQKRLYTDHCPCLVSGHKEFEETIKTLLGHFLLYVVPGGEWLYGHEVAGVFAPHRRIFVCRRRASCTPDDEEGRRDLLVFVGRVHFEVYGRGRHEPLEVHRMGRRTLGL